MKVDRPRLVRVLAAVLFLFFFVEPFIYRSLIQTWSYLFHDFPMFHEAAHRISEGENPYPAQVLRQPEGGQVHRAWEHYLYPPAFAVALVPLTMLDELNAKRLFVLISTLLYFGALLPWWIGRDGGGRGWIAGLAVMLAWGPSVETLRIGQSNMVPFACLALAYGLLNKATPRREWAAGAVAGVGAVVKLTPLLMIPLFMAGLRWRSAVGMAAGFCTILLLSGPSLNWVYFTEVAPTLGNFHELRRNHSVQSVLLRGFDKVCGGESGEWAVATAFIVSTVLFLLLLVYVWMRRDRFTAGDLLLVGCYAHTLFAGKWSHHYVTLVLPVAAVAYRLGSGGRCDLSRGAKWAAAGFFVLLLPHAYYWPPAEWMLQWTRWTKDFYNPVAMVTSAATAFPLFLYLIESTGLRRESQATGK